MPIDSPHVQTLPRFSLPLLFCAVTPEKKVPPEDQRGPAFPFLVLPNEETFPGPGLGTSTIGLHCWWDFRISLLLRGLHNSMHAEGPAFSPSKSSRRGPSVCMPPPAPR